MDTLLLLGLEAEYAEARDWVATSLRTGPDVAVNLFETTIRCAPCRMHCCVLESYLHKLLVELG